MIPEKKIRQALWILIGISLVIRALLAGMLDLGNDEVYYWTYACYPDWSHFDHPPMVGWIIQFFTLNLHFTDEFFLRLGAVIFGTINTWIIYETGKKIKDPLTGLYAALLYSASFYCFIIAGTFIMPDTPQSLFWLLSLYLLVSSLPDLELSKKSRRNILLAGITIGLALLSKYHSVFLLSGAFLYILFFNRKWFRSKEIYLALLFVMILSFPVIYWNYQNNFISFSFHESRVEAGRNGIHWNYFGSEIGGQFLYNNPVNFILIIFSFVAIIRGKKFLERKDLWVLLLISLPLSLVFIFVSLFNRTLPHWTGPAYLGFILIASAWLSSWEKKKLIPWPAATGVGVILILLILGIGQIKFGFLPLEKWFKQDFSAQMYGWRQTGEKFAQIAEKDKISKTYPSDAPILTFRWFPAANLDYYVGTPIGKKVYALGTLNRIHKYYWIDKDRGNLRKGTSAYYLVSSDDFTSPKEAFGELFDTIVPSDTIQIMRRGEVIRKVYVFRLENLRREIRFNRINDFTEPPLERIRYWSNQIRIHPDWYKNVQQKAIQQNHTLEDMIWNEAYWQARMEMLK
ncbi:MAG: glycosyltransferase family 39 protein [Bacteroidota bacterium]|nr:glycosyltransferase family 39 protein [Bacteroidota bacterium]